MTRLLLLPLLLMAACDGTSPVTPADPLPGDADALPESSAADFGNASHRAASADAELVGVLGNEPHTLRSDRFVLQGAFRTRRP